ncbi:MAG: hypothetical protein Kow0060_09130 [Methylohalobius crimeensis]
MIQLDPVIALLIAEILAGLALAALLGIGFLFRREHRERHAVGHLIKRLKHATHGHSHRIGSILEQIHALPEDKREALIQETIQREQALYKQILQSFLQRDVTGLEQLGSQLQAYTEPYHRLLKEIPSGKNPSLGHELAEARDELARSRAENEQLADQLQVAMETISHLSSEYSRLFASERTAEELKVSSDRVINTLRANADRLTAQGEAPQAEETSIVRSAS